jgi:hypothetical protein
MGKWATFLKIGGKLINNPVTRSVGNAVAHPQRTVTGLGNATKSAVVGGGLGYLAWEAIANDRPAARTASDLLIGSEATDKVGTTVNGAVDTVSGLATATGDMINTLSGAGNNSGETTGMGSFLSGIAGNPLNMLGNFLGNLGKGNISGMGIFGLVASALLIFGRFGWLGKIAGAVLGMMLIGNYSKAPVQQAQQTEESQQPRVTGIKR